MDLTISFWMEYFRIDLIHSYSQVYLFLMFVKVIICLYYLLYTFYIEIAEIWRSSSALNRKHYGNSSTAGRIMFRWIAYVRI